MLTAAIRALWQGPTQEAISRSSKDRSRKYDGGWSKGGRRRPWDLPERSWKRFRRFQHT